MTGGLLGRGQENVADLLLLHILLSTILIFKIQIVHEGIRRAETARQEDC